MNFKDFKDCYHSDMNFKDCYHSNVCGFECDDAITFCADFKDKSRIIELPCKVGDEAYYISVKRYSPLSYKLLKAKVIDFCFNRNGISAVELKTLNSNFILTLPICKVYFDKSKAEVKLKELEE